MLGDFAYRGFVVRLAADLAHPRGWFGVATITGGDLPDDHEHTKMSADRAALGFLALEPREPELRPRRWTKVH